MTLWSLHTLSQYWACFSRVRRQRLLRKSDCCREEMTRRGRGSIKRENPLSLMLGVLAGAAI